MIGNFYTPCINMGHNISKALRGVLSRFLSGRDIDGKWTTGTETPSGHNWPSGNGSQDSHGRNGRQQEVCTGEIGQGGSEGADGRTYARTPVGDRQGSRSGKVGLMPYTAIEVANELIAAHGKDDGVIDPLKLQKLLYFANGWWLAINGAPLIAERPQVWRYGPVFKTIYHAFNSYGNSPILDLAPSSPFGGEPLRIQNADKELIPLLNWIWSEYGHKSGPALSDETHKPGTPWRKIAEKYKFMIPENFTIPLKDDWEYFVGLAKERGFKTAQITAG